MFKKKIKYIKKWKMSGKVVVFLTLFYLSNVILNSACSKKGYHPKSTKLNEISNPYTKKEYEKAREVNLGIPVEKQ